MTTTNRLSPIQWAAVVAIGFAGLVHIVIAPAHWEHAPAHGLFFLLTGVIELVWAIAFLRQPSLRLTLIGIGLAVMLIVLWVLARALPAPFGHGPEEIDTWSVVCKLSELVGALALGVLVVQAIGSGAEKGRVVRVVTLAVVAGVLVGATTYVVARAAEPYFPSLMAVEHEDDHHGYEDDHHGDEPHDPDENHDASLATPDAQHP